MAVSLGPAGGSNGGRRPVDAELNLVPFIDLLVCCICFLLLVTVFVQMSRVETQISKPGKITERRAPPPPSTKVTVLVSTDGYTLTTGLARQDIPRAGTHYDDATLARALRTVACAARARVTVAVADGVSYRQLVGAMDVALISGFSTIKISDATLHL